jgi:hypothetical protein
MPVLALNFSISDGETKDSDQMAASIRRIEYDIHFNVIAGLDLIVSLPNS